jgi:phosphatidylglycerophosphate synthase
MVDVENKTPVVHSKGLGESLKTKISAQPKRLSLNHFWGTRNNGTFVWLDRITVNTLAPLLAYAGYVLRLTPNHLSIASGLCAAVAFIASLVLPSDQPNSSIILLYLFVQLSYAFDCADGLFARVAKAETNFGEFLDKSIDAATGMLCFGAVFGYMFRHYSAIEEDGLANLILIFGFLFIVARSSRHFALDKFGHMFHLASEPNGARRGLIGHTLLSLMDAQASAMGILLFLLTPLGALGFYACQTLILSTVYLRYFRRAYLHDKTV